MMLDSNNSGKVKSFLDSPAVAIRAPFKRLGFGGFLCLLLAFYAAQRILSSGEYAQASGNQPSYGTVSDADLGIVGSLNGNILFPKDNPWNQDISDPIRFPVDRRSADIIAHIGAGTGLHADFGPPPYGIPYVVVDDKQPLAKVTINAQTGYPSDSDVFPMPIPDDAPIEGGKEAYSQNADSHVIVISRTPITRHGLSLFELYRARRTGRLLWEADSVAAFDVRNNVVRPTKANLCNITSADAAGLPIFPGLVRFDEVEAGVIRHALRFTVESTRAAFVPPANHWAASVQRDNFAPMGMRVRLKASYTIPENFSRETKVILQALKTFGMIVADNGSNWFITGTSDPRWAEKRLFSELSRVKGSNFEVIDMREMRTGCP